MRKRHGILAVFTATVALCLASQAEAAKANKHKKSGAAVQSTGYRQNSAANRGTTFQGGVLAGPLYNGQDYLGDDPDPNIRAYLLKDMIRYRGSF
jgi:hypothetical protein